MGIRSPKAMGAGAAIAIAAGLSLAACGSGEDTPPPKTVPSLTPQTSERLAKRTEEVAERLESGDTCGAAHKADELDAEVTEAEIPAEIRAELDAATEQLVNSVNCPPPPKPEKKKDKGEGDEEGDHGEDGDSGSGVPGSEDLPPGLRKKFEDYEDAVLP